jgi:hypothetical protein
VYHPFHVLNRAQFHTRKYLISTTMFGLFRSKPVLHEDSAEWLFSAYAWALGNFGSEVFHQATILVTPTDQHFPENSFDTWEERVSVAFSRVRAYANMQSWPCELSVLNPGIDPVAPPAISSVMPRGPNSAVVINAEKRSIPITFDPGLIRKPLVLIAVFAQQLAYYMGRSIAVEVPGGEQLRGPASDLLAVFMGFGLFLTNSAMTERRGGCSGCGTTVQKLGYLTEDEFVYALAIFCVLKDIQNADVEPHLKKTLRTPFRKSRQEIERARSDEILRLKTL